MRLRFRRVTDGVQMLWLLQEGCENNPRQFERGATKMFIDSGGAIIKFGEVSCAHISFHD